ncbi:MAG: hypothetical protein ACRD1U_03835 [Vicinamibacterales bacterium]
MNRDRTSSSNDPTAEPGIDRNGDRLEEVVNRTDHDTTPRRYEQPVDEDEPVMPADDATLNTKI